MDKVLIKDIAEVVNGSTPSTKENSYWDGTIPWITPKDLSAFSGRYISSGERNITKEGYQSCSTTLVPKNTILLTSRAPIGYLAIAKNDLCTNQGFKSLICNQSRILPLYMFYWLSTKIEFLKSISGGATFKELSKTSLENVVMDLPNIVQQQHIVDTIGSVDDLIENLIKTQEKINTLLVHMLTNFPKKCKLSFYNPKIIKPGLQPFDNQKIYLDTASVDGTTTIDCSYLVSNEKKPSRANMQPVLNSVWSARMKGSFKVIFMNEVDVTLLTRCILSTGFIGLQETSLLPASFIYSVFLSKEFRDEKDRNSTGTTMSSINNKDFLDLLVPYLTGDEMKQFDLKARPLLLQFSSMREKIMRLKALKAILLRKYF